MLALVALFFCFFAPSLLCCVRWWLLLRRFRAGRLRMFSTWLLQSGCVSVLGQDTKPQIAADGSFIGVWVCLGLFLMSRLALCRDTPSISVWMRVCEWVKVDMQCKAPWVVNKGEKGYIMWCNMFIIWLLPICINPLAIFWLSESQKFWYFFLAGVQYLHTLFYSLLPRLSFWLSCPVHNMPLILRFFWDFYV